ncbi:hypothetical protein Cgig2_012935 [Carnegiea gigantea]|uniref:Endonuclease/exonuclease/phosphatase domain-containing protein n=1 Tax=Carnegiea gigantea TaxID=171969 RepID=A0A9Q1GNU0_9CARY|nr:hypothetical protein Cgig2_012935 [Carnegiea gigantea]
MASLSELGSILGIPIKTDKMYGHIEKDCRKKTSNRKEQREVPPQADQSREVVEQCINTQPQDEVNVPRTQSQRIDAEVFIIVVRPIARPHHSPGRASDAVRGHNTFKLLQERQGRTLIGIGLNSPNKQEDVKIFLHKENIGLVGLLEVKVKEKNVEKEALKTIAKDMEEARCILGDFNSVLHPSDRMGGTRTQDAEIRKFKECITTCEIEEMRSRGPYFT